MVKRDCKFCEFYKPTDAANGLCLYNPPAVFMAGPETSFSARPVTHPGEFCDCYKQSEEIDPDADLNVDFGAGERVRVIGGENDGREATVIADGETAGAYRIAIDGIGVVEIGGGKLRSLEE